jgi:hypothetical protein
MGRDCLLRADGKDNMKKKEKKQSLVAKFGKPCPKCKGYHASIATVGRNVASNAQRKECNV